MGVINKKEAICQICTKVMEEGGIEVLGQLGETKGWIHEDCLRENIIRLLKAKPEYVTLLRRIIDFEERNREEKSHTFSKTGRKVVMWRWSDIAIPAGTLNKLVNMYILTIMLSTRSSTDYSLVDREVTQKTLDIFEDLAVGEELENKDKLEMGEEALMEFMDKEVEMPEDLFSVIYDHEDLKTLFNMSLNADNPVHVLLIGKPASAKSMFLSEIARLQGSLYALGGTSTKAGIRDAIASGVKILLLDEIDKIDNSKELAALLQWMEDGTMTILQHNKYHKIKHPGWAFCAGNKKDKLPPELLSRFVVVHLSEYSDEELREVIKKILTEREGKTDEEAEIIADIVIGYLESKDPRDAIKIARLSKSKDDIETVARIMKKYGD